LLCSALLLVAAEARADAPRSLSVQVDPAACPNPTEVAAAFATLFSQTELLFVGAPAAAQAVFVDLGARYRVEVAGHARTIEDPDRRCPERARTAAVFAFLTLEPPVMQVPPPPPSPQPQQSQPPPKVRRSVAVQLQAGGLFESAPRTGADHSLFLGGGELRLAVGARHLAGVLAIDGVSPVHMIFPAASVRLMRVPVDVGLRAFFARGPLFGAIDLSLALAASIYDAEAAPGATERTRLDVGGRLGVWGARTWGRWGAYLGLHLVVYARPYDLYVQPAGLVGTSPFVWLGASAGLFWKIR
jgi:hypothetical protein